ncbi:hypothetical protein MA16_Dca029028 [Dendrobium catenatum]|uniref:Uncharacterized protein n=1 Tax=Dendrobium catenatum TaxID=906689 RepID=A0A2I0VC01_9ASPA|nr:hypothetical protein MA16_Dca029028 [Dendrobium catenatum]
MEVGVEASIEFEDLYHEIERLKSSVVFDGVSGSKVGLVECNRSSLVGIRIGRMSSIKLSHAGDWHRKHWQEQVEVMRLV